MLSSIVTYSSYHSQEPKVTIQKIIFCESTMSETYSSFKVGDCFESHAAAVAAVKLYGERTNQLFVTAPGCAKTAKNAQASRPVSVQPGDV